LKGEPAPLQRLRKKLTIENLWLYIISTLKRNGPTYAYDIRRRLDREYGIKPATITVYTVIYRLQRMGLIEKRPDGTYEATELGLETLRRGLSLLRDILEKLE